MLSDLKKRYSDIEGKRHFLITEVTHMAGGDVCVAAIDLQTQQIARPLQWNHRNWPAELVQNGLAPGRIVRQKIRRIQDPHGFPHQTEDTQVADALELLDHAVAGPNLFRILAPMADASVCGIFDGRVLENKYVVDGTKCRSLGAVISDPKLARLYTSYDRPRLEFSDGDRNYDLPVTDLLIWNACKSDRLGAVQKAFLAAARGKEHLMIRVGLARGWAGSSNEFDPKRCYLQVNGVIFEASGF